MSTASLFPSEKVPSGVLAAKVVGLTSAALLTGAHLRLRRLVQANHCRACRNEWVRFDRSRPSHNASAGWARSVSVEDFLQGRGESRSSFGCTRQFVNFLPGMARYVFCSVPLMQACLAQSDLTPCCTTC
jgi:hypothetical protein